MKKQFLHLVIYSLIVFAMNCVLTKPTFAAYDTVTQDNSTVQQNSGTSQTITGFTVGSSSNRLLIVGTTVSDSRTITDTTGVTYNGTNLIKLDSQTFKSNTEDTEFWYMVNPPSGAHDVVVTPTGYADIATIVVSFYNVNQSTPFGTQSKIGYDTQVTSISRAPTTTTNQLVVDLLGSDTNNGNFNPDASQTTIENYYTYTPQTGISTKPSSGTSTTMTWTDSVSPYDYAGLIAVGINPTGSEDSSYASLIEGTSGLQAYWRLGESGSTAADSSGNGRTLTYYNSPTQQVSGALAGDPDGAVQLNGSSQYVYHAAPQTWMPSGASARTVEAWVKWNGGSPVASQFFGYGNYVAGGDYAFGIQGNGYLQWIDYNSHSQTFGTTNVADGSWHYVALTYDGTSLRAYVDGRQKGSTVTQAVNTTVNSSTSIYLGSWSNFWNGRIDEVAVYNTALTDSQINSHYNIGALTGIPSSANYQMTDYGFGSGGTVNSSSANYALQATLGEIEMASMSSANYMVWPGLTYTLQPDVPPAPTFTNPSNYYNKLHININQGNNSTDVTYAIGISTDNFASDIKFLQADSTLGTSPVWQTYTAWDGATGVDVIGLSSGTTYYARVAAGRGTFTQGPLGPGANATTANASFTFGVQTSSQSNPPFQVRLGTMDPGAGIVTSPDTVTSTVSTNAVNGALIYIYGANAGLKSTTANNYTIGTVPAKTDLTSLAEGYGAQGSSVGQSSGGPMKFDSPYDGTSDTVGIVNTVKRQFADSSNQPVTNGTASFLLKAKAKTSTPAAGDYADVITLVATGSF